MPKTIGFSVGRKEGRNKGWGVLNPEIGRDSAGERKNRRRSRTSGQKMTVNAPAWKKTRKSRKYPG